MKLIRRSTFNRMKMRLGRLYGRDRSEELSARLYMLIGRYGVSVNDGTTTTVLGVGLTLGLSESCDTASQTTTLTASVSLPSPNVGTITEALLMITKADESFNETDWSTLEGRVIHNVDVVVPFHAVDLFTGTALLEVTVELEDGTVLSDSITVAVDGSGCTEQATTTTAAPELCQDVNDDGIKTYQRDVTASESDDGRAHEAGDPCSLPNTGAAELNTVERVSYAFVIIGLIILLAVATLDRKRWMNAYHAI